MWENGKVEAFEVEVGECVGDILADDVYQYISDDETDVEVDAQGLRLQINLRHDGGWDVVGVNGYPIDKTKRLGRKNV